MLFDLSFACSFIVKKKTENVVIQIKRDFLKVANTNTQQEMAESLTMWIANISSRKIQNITDPERLNSHKNFAPRGGQKASSPSW